MRDVKGRVKQMQEHTQQLQPNSIGLPGVLFQSVTTMAPAGAVAFSLGAAIPFTGGALPLAVAIALVASILIALNIGLLAKHLPSAGGCFTYVSHGLGSQAGWMAGWLYDLTYLLFIPGALLVLGTVTDSFLSGSLHLSFGPNGWIVWAVVFAVTSFALTFFGIKISANAGIILGALEIAIFGVLSICLIVTAGGGNTLATFHPASSLQSGLGGWQGVLFGMIFAFLAFSGFESCAPLAEEAQHPRRTVPRAILLAVVCIGLFYVFCSYAAVVGWGFHTIQTYPRDSNPWGTMAKRVWGPFSFLVVLAILNSALGNVNASINSVSRVLYAMGRTRALPGVLGRTNRYRTPGLAIVLVVVLGTLLAVWVGLVYSPTTAFALLGAILTVPILLVYMATCLSVPFFYLREHRNEFNVVLHVLLPAVPLVLLAIVVYFQFVPLPPAPFNLVGPINAIWLVVGLIIVVVLKRRAPQVLQQGHKLFVAQEESA
jgi:amino acid transporter